MADIVGSPHDPFPDTRDSTQVHKFRTSIHIFLVEAVWSISVLVPVLFVMAMLFEYTNAWMAIMPGAVGAVSFALVLALGSFAALLPSTYVGRWREKHLDNLRSR